MTDAVNAVELDGVCVTIAGRAVLLDLSATFPAGGCHAILGPNGAGKSTLTRLLLGRGWPTRGVVRVLGETLGRTHLPTLRRRVRLAQPATPTSPADTPTSAVLAGFAGTIGLYHSPAAADRVAGDELLQRFGLAAVADAPLATLSTGERLRVELARSAAGRAELLVLDEPTAGLDLAGRRDVLRAVAARPAWQTVLVVTHHVEELPADTGQVLLLAGGRAVAHGAAADVLRPGPMGEAFGCRVSVRRDAGRWSAWAE